MAANTNVLEKLHEQTLNDEFNKDYFDFLKVRKNETENGEWRNIQFTVSAFFKDKKYPIARFDVIQENYENNDLHFENWDLLTVNWSKGSYSDLKRDSEK